MSAPIPIPQRHTIIEHSAVLIYPMVTHTMTITPISDNYNSYKVLRRLIGNNPTSILLDHETYKYTLYYDETEQTQEQDYNHVISEFTQQSFWGRILLVDDNPGNPVISALERK